MRSIAGPVDGFGCEAPRPADHRPRLLVVSYMANSPFSPRGIRTRILSEALESDWVVELVAGETSSSPASGGRQPRRSIVRKTARLAYSSVMLDKYELWSRRRFRSWRPDADAALLVGFPYSPLVNASRRLIEHGIPYVVDVGDPWVLTGASAELHALGRLRGQAAERRLWAGAAGAILTTDEQAYALQALFPDLRVLVRPNGFAPADEPSTSAPRARTPAADGSVLRLAHFGEISSDRVDVASFLTDVAIGGDWGKVEFHQYGPDWTGGLGRLDDVTVVFHDPRPWSAVVAAAGQYDIAVVVGNRDPMLLPSKAVAYLQLPIPRLALVEAGRSDALTRYVAAKPGWIVVHVGEAAGSQRIRAHLARDWAAAELAPPAGESWDRISEEVRRFLRGVLSDGGSHVSRASSV